MSEGRFDQGRDKGDVFSTPHVISYCMPNIMDVYGHNAELAATILDSELGGLADKRIMDAGCRVGISILALARRNPGIIIAVEKGQDLLDFFQAVHDPGTDLGEFLEARNGPEILGDFYPVSLQRLQAMQWEFSNLPFAKKGSGNLHILNKAMGDILLSDLRAPVQGAIGSHWLHWPVQRELNKIMQGEFPSDREMTLVCEKALEPLSHVLTPGGVVVLIEPDDFFVRDDNPEAEAAASRLSQTAHPLFIKVHELVKEVLAEYGVDHSVPQRTELFKTSRMAKLFNVAGLKLEKVLFTSVPAIPPSPDFFIMGIPILLGGKDMESDKKAEALARIREVAARIFSAGKSCEQQPITVNVCSIVLRKEG